MLIHFATCTPGDVRDWEVRMPVVPRKGDDIEFNEGGSYTVWRVVWFPVGDEGRKEPFAYVVLR